jgi:uncharacterized PurR-regulated membrane protein YhhQ (DUF165 family)
MKRNRALGLVAAGLFVLTVYLANWALKRWGTVGVGFGLEAPAGVYFVGLAFTLRDITHRQLGRGAVVGAVLVGAALSYWLEANVTIPGGVTSIAVASAAAFLLSEFSDLLVYEPLRARGWLLAVAASNVVGLFVDSLLFLWLAFGNLDFLWGQVVGKAWMTALAVVVLLAWRQWARQRPGREPVPA